MWMREHDRGELGPSANAERGQDDGLTGVDRAADHSAPVDEHGATVGEIDDRTVALPDVEHGDAQLAPRSARADSGQLEE